MRNNEDKLKSDNNINLSEMLIDTNFKAIDAIKKDALVTSRIEGLLQFIPRYQTIEKVGQY
jgi:hypothetical protein